MSWLDKIGGPEGGLDVLVGTLLGLDLFKRRRGQAGTVPTVGAVGNKDENLKAKPFGFGTTDETLFVDAYTLAYEKGLIDNAALSKLTAINEGLSPLERGRLGLIVGADEQDVKHKSSTLERNADGSPVLDRQGKVQYSTQETQSRGNIRGMRLIVMLSKMESTDALGFSTDALGFLRSTGILNGPIDNLAEVVKELPAVWKKIDEFLAAAKIPERIDKLAFWYLSVDSRNAAMKSIAATRQRIEKQKQMSWTQREINEQPTTSRVLIALVVMIIMGAIYVFALH